MSKEFTLESTGEIVLVEQSANNNQRLILTIRDSIGGHEGFIFTHTDALRLIDALKQVVYDIDKYPKEVEIDVRIERIVKP